MLSQHSDEILSSHTQCINISTWYRCQSVQMEHCLPTSWLDACPGACLPENDEVKWQLICGNVNCQYLIELLLCVFFKQETVSCLLNYNNKYIVYHDFPFPTTTWSFKWKNPFFRKKQEVIYSSSLGTISGNNI